MNWPVVISLPEPLSFFGSMSLLVAALIILSAAIGIIALASRHKKLAASSLELIGAAALSSSVLSPEGTILIDGELWRARTADGYTIPAFTTVQIVNSQGHLLLVKPILQRSHK